MTRTRLVLRPDLRDRGHAAFPAGRRRSRRSCRRICPPTASWSLISGVGRGRRRAADPHARAREARALLDDRDADRGHLPCERPHGPASRRDQGAARHPPVLLWARLPGQFVFIWLVLRATREVAGPRAAWPPADMAHALVTGFPGFIGRRLVHKLLDGSRSGKVTALVEPRMAADGGRGGRSLRRPRRDPHRRHRASAGSASATATGTALRKSVDTVYHLAAIYNLAVPLEIAQRVNVDGTGNVVEFCAACKSLDRHVYVSTAYVAGRRTGVVYEHELVMGQDFKNHYESTKFQAEVWVRDSMDAVPTTILRPAIVVGDSKTGETEKFDGPYYMLRAIARAERMHRPIVQFGSRRTPRSTSSRSTTSSTRSRWSPATRRPAARPCSWSIPSRSAHTTYSRRSARSTRATARRARSRRRWCRRRCAPSAWRTSSPTRRASRSPT